MISLISLFTPLISQLSWGINRGHGSALRVEFGKPHLQVRNPIQARPSSEDRVKEHLASRRIFPSGQWHFLILDSEWKVSAFGKTCHCNDPKPKVDEALEHLNGQRLVSIEIEPDGKWFVLAFDLGGTLRVSLFPQDEGTCWSLSDADKGIITTFENGELETSPATQAGPGSIVMLNEKVS
jgi:hypothetical protein